jgi:phosphoribosyl 1,2-cyclic phosphodiesterase
MRVIALQSGSNGNCIFVEAAGVRLLFDAGISGVTVQQRLAAHGVDIRTVQALLISHDHGDHVRSMGTLHRQFRLPLHITEPTLAAAVRFNRLGKFKDVRHFSAGATFRIRDVTIETIPTPHDAVDGVGFVVDDGQTRLGILTDLGHAFTGLAELIESLDAVIIESNYDPQMLAKSTYPEPLKQRIRGPGGHLSNEEAAQLLAGSGQRLRWACLAHLSQQNNTPELARATHEDVLDGLPIHVASRFAATEIKERERMLF